MMYFTFIALGFFVFGVLSWTLLEYVLHRGLGHRTKARNLFSVEHMKHHYNTDYEASALKKAPGAIIVLALGTLGFGLTLGWVHGISFSVGLFACYFFYEVLHMRSHHNAPINQYELWIRKHHFYHHHAMQTNHGVTSPIWDIVFGTYVKTNIVPVPISLAKNWMLDPETKLVLPEYQKDFILVDSPKYRSKKPSQA